MGKATIAVALVVVLLIGYYAGQPGNLTRLENYVSSGAKHLSSGSSSVQSLVPSATSSATTSTTSAASTRVGGYSATPVQNIWDAYTSNTAAADAQYGGKTMLVDGSVDDVEQASGGGYQSCIYATSEGVEYGCEYLAVMGGYIVWNWANQAAAAKVPFGTTIVAQCTIGGLQSGNLILNGCTIYDVPSQDQAAQQESYCSSLTGNIAVSSLTIVAPKTNFLYAHNNNANITMTVTNRNSFPVGISSATGSLGYSNVGPFSVEVNTGELVNASSSRSVQLVVLQTTFSTNTVMAGDGVQLTLQFGEGEYSGGGVGISNACPVIVSGTAVGPSAGTTSTSTTTLPANGGFSQASFYIFGMGPTFGGATFTCSSSTTFGSSQESWIELINTGSYAVSVLNFTLTFGGHTVTFLPQGTCTIPGTYPNLAAQFLNLGTQVYFPVAPQPQEQYTGEASFSDGQQVPFSGTL